MAVSSVTIRPITDGDRVPLITAANASTQLHGPWVTPPRTNEAFDAYLLRIAQPTHEGIAVCDGKSGEIIGVVNISEIVRGHFQSAYLGYHAFEGWQGRGLMKEGLRHVLRYVFTELSLHRLEANIQPENIASIALVRGLGFRKEGHSPRYLKIAGQWMDHERWAITEEEFRV